MVDDFQPQAPGAQHTGARASIGQTLRHAREALQLTESAAAATLRMDPSILRALEADDFSRLGAAVFVRGHLRKYAELLGLDTAELLEQYRNQVPADHPPAPRSRIREKYGVDDGLSLPLAAAVVLLVLVVAFAVWRLWDHNGQPLVVYADRSADFVLPEDDVELLRAGARSVWLPASQTSESAESLPDAQPREADPRVVDAPAAALEAQPVELVVEFTDECWTEITDATGQRLFFGLGHSGQRVAVQGSPPFDVLLGNARAAELQLAGEHHPIPPGRIANNIARLQINTP